MRSAEREKENPEKKAKSYFDFFSSLRQKQSRALWSDCNSICFTPQIKKVFKGKENFTGSWLVRRQG
jgi:hypothetical protein